MRSTGTFVNENNCALRFAPGASRSTSTSCVSLPHLTAILIVDDGISRAKARDARGGDDARRGVASTSTFPSTDSIGRRRERRPGDRRARSPVVGDRAR